MTLIYPKKLSILSISTRWHSAEQKYWFAGYHLLNVDWDEDENWSHSSVRHIGFGLDTTHLKLKGLGKRLAPERHLIGFQLDADIHRLCRTARQAQHPESLIEFAETLSACMANCIDVADHFGGHAADIHAMASFRNDLGFSLSKETEDEAWENPGLPDASRVGDYLQERNALIWVILMRLCLTEQQLHQAQQAYLGWAYPNPPTPRSLLLRRRRKM